MNYTKLVKVLRQATHIAWDTASKAADAIEYLQTRIAEPEVHNKTLANTPESFVKDSIAWADGWGKGWKEGTDYASRKAQPQGKVPKKELHSIEIWDMWEESGHDPYQFARAIIAASTSKDSARLDYLQNGQTMVYKVFHTTMEPMTDGSRRTRRVDVFQGWALNATDEPSKSVREAIDAARGETK